MGCLIHRHSVGTLRHRKGKGGFLPSGRHFQTKGVAAQSEMAYKVSSITNQQCDQQSSNPTVYDRQTAKSSSIW